MNKACNRLKRWTLFHELLLEVVTPNMELSFNHLLTLIIRASGGVLQPREIGPWLAKELQR